MNANDKMNTRLIENAVILAKRENPYKMRPVKLNSNGKEMYILHLSLEAARDLRADPDWKEHALSIVTAGIDTKKDPIAMNIMGIWNNVMVMENMPTPMVNGLIT